MGLKWCVFVWREKSLILKKVFNGLSSENSNKNNIEIKRLIRKFSL